MMCTKNIKKAQKKERKRGREKEIYREKEKKEGQQGGRGERKGKGRKKKKVIRGSLEAVTVVGRITGSESNIYDTI